VNEVLGYAWAAFIHVKSHLCILFKFYMEKLVLNPKSMLTIAQMLYGGGYSRALVGVQYDRPFALRKKLVLPLVDPSIGACNFLQFTDIARVRK
jgi:hypothetical protein